MTQEIYYQRIARHIASRLVESFHIINEKTQSDEVGVIVPSVEDILNDAEISITNPNDF